MGGTLKRVSFEDARCAGVVSNRGSGFLSPVMPIVVQDKCVSALVDTGSQVTIMNEDFFDSFTVKPKLVGTAQLRMAGDQLSPAKIIRGARIHINDLQFGWDVYVAPVFDSFILGIDFMRRFGIRLDLKKGTFKIGGQKVELTMEHSAESGQISSVRLKRRTVIPPNTGLDVEVTTNLNDGKEYIISPVAAISRVMVANTLYTDSRRCMSVC